MRELNRLGFPVKEIPLKQDYYVGRLQFFLHHKRRKNVTVTHIVSGLITLILTD